MKKILFLLSLPLLLAACQTEDGEPILPEDVDKLTGSLAGTVWVSREINPNEDFWKHRHTLTFEDATVTYEFLDYSQFFSPSSWIGMYTHVAPAISITGDDRLMTGTLVDGVLSIDDREYTQTTPEDVSPPESLAGTMWVHRETYTTGEAEYVFSFSEDTLTIENNLYYNDETEDSHTISSGPYIYTAPTITYSTNAGTASCEVFDSYAFSFLRGVDSEGTWHYYLFTRTTPEAIAEEREALGLLETPLPPAQV